MLYRAFSILLTPTLILARNANMDKANVMTARCRAHCLSKFNVDGLNENCFGTPDCFMCWDTCRMFYKNFKMWGPMCSIKHLCFPGCQESCKFYYSTPDPNADASAVPDTNFTRPLIYRYQPERDAIHFEWSRPASISDSDEPFVYVLTLQDQLSRYSQEIEQTLYQNATVRRSLMKSSTIILLTAYSFSGKVAQLETRCSDLEVCVNPSREASEETFSDAKYITHDVGKHHRPEDASVNNSNHSFWSPSLVSLQYSMKDLDGVDALVTWPHVRQLDNVKYQVEWSRVEHDVDVMTSLVTQDNVATIAVWPNNVYHVHVRVFSNESRRTLTKSQPLTINTTSNSLSSNDLDCYRFKYNMALLFAVIFGLASAAVLISICLRKFRFRLI